MSRDDGEQVRGAILAALTAWIDSRDYPPTVAELAEHLNEEGFKISTSNCTHHMNRLIRDGRVRAEGERTPRWIPVCYPDGRPWLRRSDLLTSKTRTLQQQDKQASP